jgi:hypothetical protein
MAKQDCHYHRTNPAVRYCAECPRYFCAECIPTIAEGYGTASPRCPLCGDQLTFLGAANTAKPFWTVAHRFFLYPFAGSGIALMALMAVSSLLLTLGLFGLVVAIGMFAVTMKYGFAVLESVAAGDATAPTVNQAISADEDHLFLRFVGLMLALGLVQVVAASVLGSAIGFLTGLLVTLVMPAAVVFLALEKRTVSALNPSKLIWLISRIGLPYLLVVFLFETISSGPFLVLALFAESMSLQALLTMTTVLVVYFTIVNFAMLGYVIFENQGTLGFTAADGDEEALDPSPANLRKRLFGEVNILVREGRLDQAKQRLDAEASRFDGDVQFLERQLQLLTQSADADRIGRVTDAYLDVLDRKGAHELALDAWRKARAIDRSYLPKHARISHALAERAWARNLGRDALVLLGNLHKREPAYAGLDAAYWLAAEVFRSGFDDEVRARQLEQFVARRNAQAESKSTVAPGALQPSPSAQWRLAQH